MREPNLSVYFVTKNRAKFLEATRIAVTFGVRLKHLKIEKQEIQADKLSEIASFAAMQAANSSDCSVVSEDAGFFVDALRGFPGPYSSYVHGTLDISGILKLMKNVKQRGACFSAALAYCEPGQRPVCFTGVVRGVVGKEARGAHGFGFDPIFIPLQGDGRTFAEMTTDEKNSLSHRAKAFAKFSKWFTSSQRIGFS